MAGKRKKELGERRIEESQSIRVGNQTFKTGQEDELHRLISQENADRHVLRGRLQGDWSGAGGEYQTLREKTAEARTLRQQGTLAGAVAEMRKRQAAPAKPPVEDDNGPVTDGLKGPFRIEGGEGGWYSFFDVNNDQVMRGDGEAYRVQGLENAEAELAGLK